MKKIFNINLIKQEVKNYFRFSIIWLSVLVGIFLLYSSFFSVIKSEVDTFIALFENMPEEVLAMFGGKDFLEHIGTFNGFYTMVSQTIFLAGGIMAMLLGLKLLNKEFKDKTIEFIATKPIKRYTLIASKLITGLLILIFINIILTAITLLVGSAYLHSASDFKVLFLLSNSLFLIELLFFFTGFLLSVIFNKLEATNVIGLGVVFFSFFIGALLSSKFEFVKVISYFYYFPKNYILSNSSYELPYLIITLIVIISFTISSFLLYQRKDLSN